MLHELALITVSVGIEQFSLSVPKAVLPFSLIDGAVGIDHLSVSVEQGVGHLTCVPGTVVKQDGVTAEYVTVGR